MLTWDTFRRMKSLYFAKEGSLQQLCAGVLFGLELQLQEDANKQLLR